MLDVVRRAVAIVLEVDPAAIDRTSTLEELDADSLARVEVAEIVEQSLAPEGVPSFRIPDGELAALRTIGDAVDVALARL